MDSADIDLASVDHVLMTTRAVRKRFDLTRPVEREVIERCIEIAIQAPTALYGET
jgi:nitroreductase